MRLRRFLAVLAATTLLLTACGDDDDAAETTTTTAPTEEGEGEETEDTLPEAPDRGDADLVIWADDTRTPVLRTFAEEFGAENDVNVVVFEVAGGATFSQIRDMLQVAGPAGQGPDIIIGAHDWLGELTANGAIAPIDLGAAEAGFDPVALDAFRYEGQLYGLPYSIENVALIRNTELVPEAPATFEELEQIGLQLLEEGRVTTPLVIQNSPPDPFHNYPLFSAAGGYVFGETDQGYDPDDIGIDSEGGLAAARYFAEWAESGLINPEITYDLMMEQFGNGQAAFAITGPWAVTQDDIGFRARGVPYAVGAVPPLAGNDARPFVGVQGFMISAFAENSLLAQTFLVDYMASEEAQVALYEAGGRPPALLAAAEAAADDPDTAGFGEAGRNGYPMPAIPEMGAVWTAWTDAYTLVFQGSDPEQAFRDAANQIRSQIGG
jgi:arabinogalactan oligomer / maltooligosaccharide transport system substrate-binding protein